MTAQKVLEVARSQVGVKESPANSNNVIYNTHYYGQAVHDGLWGTKFPWCAVFVWDMFRMAGASALYYGGGKTASCPTLLSYYKKQGQVLPFDQTQPGDIVFFTFSTKKNADHVGIVESVSGGVLTTIEGNTSVGNDGNGGMVMRRSRKQNVVLAVVRPKYEKEDELDMAMTKNEVEFLIDQAVKKAVAEAVKPEKVYTTLDELPWGRDSVERLMEAGIIQGDGTGKLHLTDHDLVTVSMVDKLMLQFLG